MRKIAKYGVVMSAAGLVVGLSAGTASAHVTIAEPEHVAGQYTLLTFGVPHGCDASPTTEVRIQMPESIPQVTPTVNPGWDVEKVMEALDEPIEGGHGTTLTERVAEVVYTAHTPLPADLRDAFELSLKAPDLPGETIYFPTVQTCVEGETGWVELPTADVPAEELESPAPMITLVATAAGTDDGHGADAAAGTADGATADGATVADVNPAASAATQEADEDSNALAIVALVVGAAGLLVGGASFALRRKAA